MRHFNPPPGWPEPPNARWRPPKSWKPDDDWPKPPAGWSFWVDENGVPVRGPVGRYGGPPVLKMGALAAVVITLVGLLLVVPYNARESATTTPSLAAPESSTPSETTDPGDPAGASPSLVGVPPRELTSQSPSQSPSQSTSPAPGPATSWFPPAQPANRPATLSPPWSPTKAAATPNSPAQPSTQPSTEPFSQPPSTQPPSTIQPSTPPSSTVPGPTTTTQPSTTPSTTQTTPPATTPTVVYKNCAEVRAAGKAPLYRGDPGYTPALDRNGDGIACERGNP
ncbi:excalibur calcium-binding domain-containing protein [Kribbella sp. NPDC050470]|uniref:excalibur calcium-binding domain-containing protein n=1 Tax=unclassified Kribbella TaxID=2644121 RepID=UPI00379FB8F5